MMDFKAAYAEGLEAAKKAEAAKADINGIFTEMNRQLTEATEGKLEIQREVFVERPEGIFAMPALFTQPKKYKAIAAINPKVPEAKHIELARWEMDRAGYPCKLIWADREECCEDRDALEIQLANLLRDPLNAEKLLGLTKRQASDKKEPYDTQ